MFMQYEKKSFGGYEVGVHNHAEEVDGTVHDSGDKICAKGTDDEDTANLKVVPCFLPTFLVGPYWVLAYDEDEGYALVSGGQPTIKTPDGCKNGSGTNNSGLWMFGKWQRGRGAVRQEDKPVTSIEATDNDPLKR